MIRPVWLALTLIVCCGAAQADEICTLQPLAQFDAKAKRGNILYAPATFGSRHTKLAIVTGGWSELREPIAQEMKLQPQRIRTTKFRGAAGDSSTDYVVVPEFLLGSHRIAGAEFLVATETNALAMDEHGGLLGADRLSTFDLEIDGATKAVTLYKPDIFCAGRVTRWTDKPTIIPFKLVDEIPDFEVEIDGKEVTATLHTGANSSLMNIDVARRLFNVTPDSSGARRLGEQAPAGGNSLELFSYQFKTLNMRGLVLNDIRVVIGDFNDIDFALGMRDIERLHIYVAYRRKVMYATLVDGAAP